MRRTITLLATALLALAMLGAAPAALADPGSDSANLREAVTLKNVRKHQQALQAIADANGGTRAAGTPGYDRSVDYVVNRLRDAGYAPQLFRFTSTSSASWPRPSSSRPRPPRRPTRPGRSPTPAAATSPGP
jgi:hypothetical protein